MSDFNVYDMLEAEDLARTASVKHSQEVFREAVFEADERFGSYLRSASDQSDFMARLSNVKRDFKRVVAGYLEPTPPILTSVAKAVQSLGRTMTDGQFSWMDGDDYSTAMTPDGCQLWVALDSHDDGVESWEEGEWSLFDENHTEVAQGTEVNASQARNAVENAYQGRTSSKERGARFRREALNQDEVADEIDRIFSEAEGWEPMTSERLDWYKGEIQFYGWVGMVNQGEDTVFEFRGGSDEAVKAAEYVVRRESFNGFVPAPDAGQFQSSKSASEEIGVGTKIFHRDYADIYGTVVEDDGTSYLVDGPTGEAWIDHEDARTASRKTAGEDEDSVEDDLWDDAESALQPGDPRYVDWSDDPVLEDARGQSDFYEDALTRKLDGVKGSGIVGSRKQASVLRWEPYDEMGSVYAKIPGVGAVLEARADGTWNVYVDESFENTVAWGIEEDLEQAKNKCEIAAYRKFGWPGEIVGKKHADHDEGDWSEYSDNEILQTAEMLSKVDPNSKLWPQLVRELESRGIYDQVTFLGARAEIVGKKKTAGANGLTDEALTRALDLFGSQAELDDWWDEKIETGWPEDEVRAILMRELGYRSDGSHPDNEGPGPSKYQVGDRVQVNGDPVSGTVLSINPSNNEVDIQWDDGERTEEKPAALISASRKTAEYFTEDDQWDDAEDALQPGDPRYVDWNDDPGLDDVRGQPDFYASMGEAAAGTWDDQYSTASKKTASVTEEFVEWVGDRTPAPGMKEQFFRENQSAYIRCEPEDEDAILDMIDAGTTNLWGV